MWARVVECMLGCWLAVSPFVFRHEDDDLLTTVDAFAAAAVITLALLSYWRPLRHAHLGIVFVALAMIGFGRFAGGVETGPAFQNHILVGLLLVMFAVVPNNANEPPQAWNQQAAGTRTKA
jgi:hypothetical protein